MQSEKIKYHREIQSSPMEKMLEVLVRSVALLVDSSSIVMIREELYLVRSSSWSPSYIQSLDKIKKRRRKKNRL